MSEFIKAGDQVFKKAYGGSYDIVRQMLWEVDPNLEVTHPQYAPQGWAILWCGNDGEWHAVMVNKSGDPRQLLLAPHVMRERDRNSPVNSRESAFERDLRKKEEADAAREAAMVDKVAEAAERVYAGLRKDVGHHYGVTSKRYFDFGGDKTARM